MHLRTRIFIVLTVAAAIVISGAYYGQEVHRRQTKVENGLAAALTHTERYVHESLALIDAVLSENEANALHALFSLLTSKFDSMGRWIDIVARLDPVHDDEWRMIETALSVASRTAHNIVDELLDDNHLSEAGVAQVLEIQNLLQAVAAALPGESGGGKATDPTALKEAARRAQKFVVEQRILHNVTVS